MKYGLIIFLLLGYAGNALSQSILSTRMEFGTESLTVSKALLALSQESGVPIAYSSRFFSNDQRVTIPRQEGTIRFFLEQLLAGTRISYKVRPKQIILFRQPPPRPQTYTVSGYVEDAETGERIIGARIICPQHKAGTYSNPYGFYSLSLPQGQLNLQVSYLGKSLRMYYLGLTRDTTLHFSLTPDLTLEEVIVTPGTPDLASLSADPTAQYNLRHSQLNAAPTIGGQEDLMQLVRQLPSVQTGASGLGGMHVRGGDNSHNLMLLDGVPVYNPSHLLGIFSVYNSRAVRSAQLITGAFPARYGGRLASVLDVRTREGNMKTWSGEFGAGLLSAGGMLEGPIKKDKGAILVSGRSTLSDFLLAPSLRRAFVQAPEGNLSFGFFDLNAKANYTLSPKDRIYLSFHGSGDAFDQFGEENDDEGFEYGQESNLRWGNTIAALRWNHLFNNQLFSNLTLTYSRYQFANAELGYEYLEEEDEYEDFFFYEYGSEIQDWAAKWDFHYLPSPRKQFHFGAELIQHRLQPEATYYDEDSEEFQEADSINLSTFTLLEETPYIYALEGNVYAEAEWEPHPRWYFNLGSRFSSQYSEGEWEGFWEPRFSLRHVLFPGVHIHAGVSKMVQYLHQVSSSGLSLPSDIWISSSPRIRPQRSWQYEAGLHFLPDNQWKLSTNVYLKSMKNLYAFSDSLPFVLLEDDLDAQLEQGEGLNYGWEIMLQKSQGRTGGWINYTLAHAQRRFDFQNLGRRYPYEFDQRHLINAFLYHKFTPSFTLGLSWNYASANPQLSFYTESGILNYERIDPLFSESKNATRTSPTHRLDISLSYQSTGKKLQHRFKVGAYNLYNRKNVAFHTLDFSSQSESLLKPVYLLPRIPSFSYQVSF